MPAQGGPSPLQGSQRVAGQQARPAGEAARAWGGAGRGGRGHQAVRPMEERGNHLGSSTTFALLLSSAKSPWSLQDGLRAKCQVSLLGGNAQKPPGGEEGGGAAPSRASAQGGFRTPPGGMAPGKSRVQKGWASAPCTPQERPARPHMPRADRGTGLKFYQKKRRLPRTELCRTFRQRCQRGDLRS